MATRSSRTREHLKYGLCLNEECPKCKAKEIQAIPMRKDFVCPECSRELRECPPPKKSNLGKIIGIIIALIIIIGVIAAICLFGGETEKSVGTSDSDSVKVDTIATSKPAVDPTKIKKMHII